MSLDALSWAFRLVLPPIEKLVLLSLAERASGKWGHTYSSVRDLRERTGLCERAVQNATHGLADKQLLAVEIRFTGSGRQTSNRYWLSVGEAGTVTLRPLPEKRERDAARAKAAAGGDAFEGEEDESDAGGLGQNTAGGVHSMHPSPRTACIPRTFTKEPSKGTPSTGSPTYGPNPYASTSNAHTREVQTRTQKASGSRAKESSSKSPKRTVGQIKQEYETQFQTWYALYPKKVGRLDAETAFAQAIQKGATPEQIMAGLRRNLPKLQRLFQSEPQFVNNPATWLRGGHWDDAPEPSPAAAPFSQLNTRL